MLVEGSTSHLLQLARDLTAPGLLKRAVQAQGAPSERGVVPALSSFIGRVGTGMGLLGLTPGLLALHLLGRWLRSGRRAPSN